jgi:OOP family OmpA-OmpF porin
MVLFMKSRALKFLVLILSASPLVACTGYSLQELKTATPKGTPLQAALAMRYLKYSEEQAAAYDWGDSTYFADKGLQAAYGADVAPEGLERWAIPEDSRGELETARAQLMEVLAGPAVSQQPQLVADAQYYYDCWVENTDDGWQPDAIAWCRDGYETAMTTLLPAGGMKANDELLESGYDTERKAYIVFFGTNNDGLDDRGERMVEGVVNDLQQQPDEDYVITLNGHADTAGGERYNLALSNRRADAVKAALLARGIRKALIRSFGFGETDPVVPTEDGVSEPKNRRVEIYLGD